MSATQKGAAIYLPTADAVLAGNQRAALTRYAIAMGWTIVGDAGPDQSRITALAASGSIDVVLSWRTSEVPDLDGLLAACRVHQVEFLALAQSCSALPE